MVYHALQKVSDEATLETVILLEDKTQQLQEQLTGLKAYAKATRAELTTLCATPLTSDIRQNINHLKQEKETAIANLAQTRRTNAVHVEKEDQTETEREWKRWQKRVNVRRRICHDLWRRCLSVVAEGMSQEEFWESLGLEGTPLLS